MHSVVDHELTDLPGKSADLAWLTLCNKGASELHPNYTTQPCTVS